MQNLPVNQVICCDVSKRFLLPDECIDVCITSPPYWGLRNYGVDGQIGIEKHPQEYIDKLVLICREIKRVLKKSGSFYLNLGDTYFGGGQGGADYGGKEVCPENNYGHIRAKSDGVWLRPKQLMLIPSRVAIALQEDGWILRNDIIWRKPNPMPSSVKDRLNTTYEHLFHFVKARKYYYDLDAIRVPHKAGVTRWGGNIMKVPLKQKEQQGRAKALLDKDRPWRNPKGKNPGDVLNSWGADKNLEYHGDGKHNPMGQSPSDLKRSIIESYKKSPKGKNPGDVLEITTRAFKGAHFAVFPEDLLLQPLKSSCPKNGVVFDPFCGRGTVGKVAKQLGLNYVLFDIKPEYCEMARLYIGGQKVKTHKDNKKLEIT